MISRRSFFGAAMGVLIEYYDYTLYAIFLPILSPLFFPAATTYDSLVKNYWVIFIAMLARPIGGLVFGRIGDGLGRRRALIRSMYGIALATITIGCIPSYATFGIWAPLLLLFCKIIQVFCFGGEYNGAGIYVVEHANKNREASQGSLLTAMTLVGALLASLVGIIATLPFMPAWSWRVAFVLGGFIGIFAIFYRKKMLESPQFIEADLQIYSLKNMIQQYPAQLVAGIFIGGFSAAPFTTILIFINPALMSHHVITKEQLMLTQSLLIALSVIFLIASGKLADRYSPFAVMRIGCLLLIFLSYPLLSSLHSQHLLWIVFSQMLLVFINEILLGPANAYLKNLFPMQFRYRGASLSSTLGVSLLGGLTPLVENYLYQITGSLTSSFIWLCFIGLGTFFSMQYLQIRFRSPVEQLT